MVVSVGMRMRRRMLAELVGSLSRNDDELAVAHAPFAYDMLSEMLDLGLLTLKQGHFETARGIDMNTKRCDRKI